jgi:hypothetical protein
LLSELFEKLPAAYFSKSSRRFLPENTPYKLEVVSLYAYLALGQAVLRSFNTMSQTLTPGANSMPNGSVAQAVRR